jgi:hypothetical protein
MGPVIVASEAATEVHVDLIKPILRTSAPSDAASLGWRIVEAENRIHFSLTPISGSAQCAGVLPNC